MIVFSNLLEEALQFKKLNLNIFTCASSHALIITPQTKRKYSFSLAAFFGKSIPPQQKRKGGETMIILSMFGTAAWNFY